MSTISDILLETFNGVVKLQTNMCERKFTSVVIPKEVKSVGNYAFAGCEDLTKVDFSSKPNSIADTAFLNCQNLAEINAPWRIGAVPGAPWGADNAIINYLLQTQDVSMSINRLGYTDIVAPSGSVAASARIENQFNGDGYDSYFRIESSYPTIYLYTYDYNEANIPTNWIEVNLKYYNAGTQKYYFDQLLGGVSFEDDCNLILNRPDVYPVAAFILSNSFANDYGDELLDYLGVSNELVFVGKQYSYNIKLLGEFPEDGCDARLKYKADGSYVDGVIGYTCEETFEIECYDIYTTDDMKIFSSFDLNIIKNNFLRFAFKKALDLLKTNFDLIYENIFELTY